MREKHVAELHRRLYTEEYSWGPAFIGYAAGIAMDFAKKEKNSREELFIAEYRGHLAGCIMLCQTDDHDVGQLRLFAVEKSCRRHGIKALMDTVMSMARTAGYKKKILWTASPLYEIKMETDMI